MFNAFTRALALSSLVLALACSKSSGSSTAAAATTTLSGSVQTTGSGYTGSGSLIYNTPLDSIQSGHSWALAFTLQDGGSLTLLSNTNNQLGSGVAVRFARTGAVLSVTLKAAGAETDVSSAFTSVDASGSMSLQVDIHNDETPAHVLVWSGTDFSEGAALLNSEDAGNEVPGSGSGTFWGLELNNATVSTIERTSPKFEE